MTETNSAKLSEEILLKVNTKLQKESTIFHKVNHGEKFTKEDVRAYALSQVQTKQDELELYRVLLFLRRTHGSLVSLVLLEVSLRWH